MRAAELSNYRQFVVRGDDVLIRLCWSCSTGHRMVGDSVAQGETAKRVRITQHFAGVSIWEHMPSSGIIYMIFPVGDRFLVAHLLDERWRCGFQLIQFLQVDNQQVFSQNLFYRAWSVWGIRKVLKRSHLAQLHVHVGNYSRAPQDSIQNLLLI